MSPLRWRPLILLLAAVSVLSAGLFSAVPASAATVKPAPSFSCSPPATAVVVVAVEAENRVKGIFPATPTRTGVSTADVPNSVWENGLPLRFFTSGVTVSLNGYTGSQDTVVTPMDG